MAEPAHAHCRNCGMWIDANFEFCTNACQRSYEKRGGAEIGADVRAANCAWCRVLAGKEAQGD